MSKKRKNHRDVYKVVNMSLFIVVGIVIMIAGFIYYKQETQSIESASQTSTTVVPTQQSLNVYEKLKKGQPIRYLIIGDSIADGTGAESQDGAWYDQLNKMIKEKYNLSAFDYKITRGGTTVFHSWYEYENAKDINKSDIDMVFVCDGQNDKGYMTVDQYGGMYENLIRQLKKDMPNADILPIIESSIRDNETFPNEVNKLSQYYNLTPVDTRKTFNDSGIPYNQLTKDGVHPNDKGHMLYAQAIFNQITDNMNQNRKIETSDKQPITLFSQKNTIQMVQKFDTINGFTEDPDNAGYLIGSVKGNILETSFEGDFLGLDLLYNSDGGSANVYIDGNLIEKINENLPFKRDMKILVSSGLQYGKHTVKLETIDKTIRIGGIITN